MHFHVIVAILLTTILLVCIYSALSYRFRRPRLTILDAQKLIRKANSDEFHLVLNGQVDAITRTLFSRKAFIDSQRLRIMQAREYLICMHHDALVFLALARTELWREIKMMPGMEDRERFIEAARELEIGAVQFRVYAALTLIRMRWWILFRLNSWLPFSQPRISDLRETWGLNFYPCYQRLKGAVGALCLEYGQEFYDEIIPLL